MINKFAISIKFVYYNNIMLSHFDDSQIISEIKALNASNKSLVYEFVRSLKQKSTSSTDASSLLRFAGFIPKDDLALMEKAIDQDCGKIDHSEW